MPKYLFAYHGGGAPTNPEDQKKVMDEAIAELKNLGAVVVDPAEIPSFIDKDAKSNFLEWPYCSGADQAKGHNEGCSVNFDYGMKRDFNA